MGTKNGSALINNKLTSACNIGPWIQINLRICGLCDARTRRWRKAHLHRRLGHDLGLLVRDGQVRRLHWHTGVRRLISRPVLVIPIWALRYRSAAQDQTSSTDISSLRSKCSGAVNGIAPGLLGSVRHVLGRRNQIPLGLRLMRVGPALCRVPLSFLISVGSGFRPAIWVQSLVIVNMEASNPPENSQCAKPTSSQNASFSPLWRLI